MNSQAFTLPLGILLTIVGLLQYGVARDKRLWVSYAVESFRYCSATGFTMIGIRLIWVYAYGAEATGVSLWAQCAYFSLSIGQLGMQMNNLAMKTMHVPKFLRKAL